MNFITGSFRLFWETIHSPYSTTEKMAAEDLLLPALFLYLLSAVVTPFYTHYLPADFIQEAPQDPEQLSIMYNMIITFIASPLITMTWVALAAMFSSIAREQKTVSFIIFSAIITGAVPAIGAIAPNFLPNAPKELPTVLSGLTGVACWLIFAAKDFPYKKTISMMFLISAAASVVMVFELPFVLFKSPTGYTLVQIFFGLWVLWLTSIGLSRITGISPAKGVLALMASLFIMSVLMISAAKAGILPASAVSSMLMTS